MKRLLLLLGSVLFFTINAQTPTPILKKFWDGFSSYPVVLATKDNCALLIGGFDYWYPSQNYIPNHIVKLDSLGSLIYSKEQVLMPTSSVNKFARYFDGTLCEANNFMVVGALGTSMGMSLSGYTACCIKYDGAANVFWYKTISDPGLKELKPNSVSFCKDSGFVLCGTATDLTNQQHGFIARLDKNGNLNWLKWGSPQFAASSGSAVKQTSDSGYVMIGSLFSSTQSGTVLWKFDKLGNLQWSKQFCSGNSCSIGLDVIELGNYFFCLASESSDLLFKCDLNGNLIWNRRWGTNTTKLSHVKKDQILLTKGTSGSALVDTAGNGHWSVLTGFDCSGCALKNRSYMLVVDCLTGQGNSIYTNQVIVLDSNATITSTCIAKTGLTPTSATMSVNQVNFTLQSGGMTTSKQATVNPLALVVHDGCMYDLGTGISSQDAMVDITLFPNPATDQIEVGPVGNANPDFELYDLTGRSVLINKLNSKQATKISLHSIPGGTYVYKISINDGTPRSGKLIILR